MSDLPFHLNLEAGIDMSDMKNLMHDKNYLLSLWKSVEN